METIPFSKSSINYEKVIRNIIDVLESRQLSGNGNFTKKCQSLLETMTGCEKVLLTSSATTALEMSAILADVHEGDEIIMPSFTFTSTANAFVLRGAVPVFVDVKESDLNIDENKIEQAITEKTRAIVPVHYGGTACEMYKINEIADRYNLIVIEDAAQCILSFYDYKHLGTFGNLGVLSFHGTKNIASGEGGALLINDMSVAERAEIIWEKGTNRIEFEKGKINKYTWIDIGSSFMPNEITAALLLGQLMDAERITARRKLLWDRYFWELEQSDKIELSNVEPSHNAHIFWILTFSKIDRNFILKELEAKGIKATTHYVPLHLSPFGKKFIKNDTTLPVTESISDRLIRLPLYDDMTDKEQDRVIAALWEIFYV